MQLVCLLACMLRCAWSAGCCAAAAAGRGRGSAAFPPRLARSYPSAAFSWNPRQALQWLRHGCLPVIVAEGRAPAEKAAAQRARFAARNGGRAGGGTSQGAAQFQKLGATVGGLLETLVGA